MYNEYQKPPMRGFPERVSEFGRARTIAAAASVTWSIILVFFWIFRAKIYLSKGDIWNISQLSASFAAITLGVIAIEIFFRRGYLLLDFLLLSVSFSITSFISTAAAVTTAEGELIEIEFLYAVIVGVGFLLIFLLEKFISDFSKHLKREAPILWLLHPTVVGLSSVFTASLIQATMIMFIGSASYLLISLFVAGISVLKDFIGEVKDQIKEDVYMELREGWRNPLSPEEIYRRLRVRANCTP